MVGRSARRQFEQLQSMLRWIMVLQLNKELAIAPLRVLTFR